MPGDSDRLLAEHGRALADAITEALPGWVVRSVLRRGGPVGPAEEAGAQAAEALGPKLRALLTADVDDQRVNPLALVRDAVAYPTRVLRDAGVAPPPRARFDEEHFPEDPYGLVPMTWRDVDESLHDVGILWGALKARAHKERHG